MSSVSSWDRDDVKIKGVDKDGEPVSVLATPGSALLVQENHNGVQVQILRQILAQMIVMNKYLSEISDLNIGDIRDAID